MIRMISVLIVIFSTQARAAKESSFENETTAWNRFNGCGRLLPKKPGSSSQESAYFNCLTKALAADASAIERQKATEFLMLRLHPGALTECPARNSNPALEGGGKGTSSACFRIEMKGPDLGGKIEFSPASKVNTDLKVRSVDYGF